MTIVQVMGSLIIYALFVSNVHSESQVKDLDDYVYYINAGSKIFEFLVAVVVLGYTAWATITGEWNYIGMSREQLFSVTCIPHEKRACHFTPSSCILYLEVVEMCFGSCLCPHFTVIL